MANRLRILSWNIQNAKGCDGRVDLNRIIVYLKAQEPLDLICLQEVARFFPEYTTPEHPDQLTALAKAFPEYLPVWGAALSWPGERQMQRREYGNLTLVRQQLLDSRLHVLPGITAHSASGVWRTPRCAVETLIAGPQGPLRVLNTHLAYHDIYERQQQLEYLSSLQAAANRQQQEHNGFGHGIFAQPYQTDRTLVCGDLNLDSTSEQYFWLRDQGWKDAWSLTHVDQPHHPTCGIFDAEQWPQGPHCRDFFMLQYIKPLNLHVDTTTQLSDHQPLVLTLEH